MGLPGLRRDEPGRPAAVQQLMIISIIIVIVIIIMIVVIVIAYSNNDNGNNNNDDNNNNNNHRQCNGCRAPAPATAPAKVPFKRLCAFSCVVFVLSLFSHLLNIA